MRVLIQRVTNASVTIDGAEYSSIGGGLLVLLGVGTDDTTEDAQWLAAKVASLRIFDDAEGVMNLDIRQTGGDALVVSQFTLLASTRKGNRPSYIKAAREDTAVPLYEKFVDMLETQTGRRPSTGVFGTDTKVALTNDGPVTIWIDSRNR